MFRTYDHYQWVSCRMIIISGLAAVWSLSVG